MGASSDSKLLSAASCVDLSFVTENRMNVPYYETKEEVITGSALNLQLRMRRSFLMKFEQKQSCVHRLALPVIKNME